MKIDVMGVLFDNVTMEQALDRAETLMEAKASAYCVTPNGEIVWEAMQDPAFRSILNEADLSCRTEPAWCWAPEFWSVPCRKRWRGSPLPRPWCSAWLPGAGGCICWAAGLGLQRKRRKI